MDPNNQLVPYNPDIVGRMQGDHSNGTWNNVQPNAPNAYYIQNSTADRLSHGASKLREASVEAVEAEAH
jgi:hypothetical protein